MLPFGVKIAWFVLSATGLLSCWIVLWAFRRAVGTRWPLVYGLGNTLLQGMFCLGMIYRMDPFLMPRSFCYAQTIIISFGAYLITGVTLAFSIATNMTVLKPKTWGDGQRALRWRNMYAIPIVLFPVVATIIHIVLIMKFNSVQPTDDMHCDSTDPEWVRFLGYAGVPFLMSLPSLFLSIRSIKRVHKTNLHLHRSRPESIDGFPSSPCKREFSISGLNMLSSPGPMAQRRESIAIAPGMAHPAKFHLPFRRPPALNDTNAIDDGRESSHFSLPSGGTGGSSPRVSVSFPRFVDPNETSPTAAVGEGERAIELRRVHIEERQEKKDWHDIELVVPRQSDSVAGDGDGDGDKEWNEDKADLRSESDVGKDDYILDIINGEHNSPRPTSMIFSPMGTPYRKPRRQPPSLSPAVWRIILFQVAFTTVQFLACISTIIDLATKRTTPIALGTQHFALLLAAWGPAIVFGHLPAVRRNLIPWHPASL